MLDLMYVIKECVTILDLEKFNCAESAGFILFL